VKTRRSDEDTQSLVYNLTCADCNKIIWANGK